MKQIPLSGGRAHALVDDHWYDYLMQWKWSLLSTKYAVRVRTIGKKQKMILMHRVVAQTPDDMYTDHINRKRVDNQEVNLRNCTNSQNNSYNGKRKLIKATSPYKGVSLNRKNGMWHVALMKDYTHYHIGDFAEERHAAMAYDIAAKDLFGEFATTNFQSLN